MESMMKKLIKLCATTVLLVLPISAFAASGGPIAPEMNWPSAGFFGSFDKASLQRGLKIYTNNCSGCHSLNLLSYRDLEYMGYSPDQIKAYAAEFEVLSEPNDDGERELKPASPSDGFVSPYANEQEARSLNNGALPPDLSLIVKARAAGKGNIPANFYDMLRGRGYASGADYIYALMTGYQDAPEDFALAEGMHYNKYFSGNAIAMSQPLFEDDESDDGKPGTVEQQAKDIASFLMWASEPKLEERRGMGVKVMLFMLAFFFVMLVLKRRVWRDVH